MRISPRPAALVACAALALGGAGTALGATAPGPGPRLHTEAPHTRHGGPPLAAVGAGYLASWSLQREAGSLAPISRADVVAVTI